MKPGAMMKSMCAGLFVFCFLAVCAGSARADDWLGVAGGSKDIEVFIKKDSSATGDVRTMQLKFVNHGDSDIALTYTAIIKCPGNFSRDADTGKANVKRHSDTTTSFSYPICPGDDSDNTSMFEVRIKPYAY